MPVIQCIYCGKGRRYKNLIAKPRCRGCLYVRKIQRRKDNREEWKRKKLCQLCGDQLSAHSIFSCDRCGGYHAGYQAHAMRQKRAKSPAYRADERNKVRERMRAIRAERRKAGVNNDGVPYSEVWKRRMMGRDGAGLSAS
jgi:hypothetical protein